MTTDENLSEFSELDFDYDWVSELKPYQVKRVKALMDSGLSEIEVVDRWVDQPRIPYNSPFGLIQFESNLGSRVLGEMKKLICGDKSYKKLRKDILDSWEKSKTVVLATIAGAIGATLGIAAGVLTPIVATILKIVGTVGVNAWCLTPDGSDETN